MFKQQENDTNKYVIRGGQCYEVKIKVGKGDGGLDTILHSTPREGFLIE